MKPWVIHCVCGAAALATLAGTVGSWVAAADTRAQEALAAKTENDSKIAVASPSDETYCTPALKEILRRVLTSCGLVKGQQGRGCQPVDAQKVANMSGDDFNALFAPLSKRAAIIQYDRDNADLDDGGKALLEKTFSDQRGASYFLTVARTSPEGSTVHNRELSQARAEAALEHLEQKFSDPDLEREVGLLWLGEEFAQLDEQFCGLSRSRAEQNCTSEQLNRSAFVAWIDCRL